MVDFLQSLRLIATFLGRMSRHRKLFLLGMAGIVGQAVFYIVFPLLFARIVDRVVPGKRLDELSVLLAQFFTLMTVCFAAAIFQVRALSLLGSRVMSSLREEIARKFTVLTYNSFSGCDTVDLLSRLSSDLDRVENAMTKSLPAVIEGVLLVLACLSMLAWIEWRMMAAALLLLPAAFLGNAWLGRKEDGLNSQTRRAKNKLMASSEDFVNSWIMIRMSGLASYFLKRFGASNREYSKHSGDYADVVAAIPTFSDYAINAAVVVIVLIGSYLSIEGMLSIGALIGSFALLRKAADSGSKVARNYTAFFNANRPYNRIMKLLAEEEDRVIVTGTKPLGPVEHGIVFQEVKASYASGREIFNGLNLVIPARRKLAIVGPTGSGKSSLQRMVSRMLEPKEGRILVDGEPIDHFTKESLHSEIGFLIQEQFLVRGSIAENIALSKPSATRAEIEAAARLAHVHEDIVELPLGYDTEVDARFSSLSGGQRQRIAIARLILQDPGVAFLDEPTSMLDAITESAVIESLLSHFSGRTFVVVSHRLTFVKDFDLIVVMEKGRVVGTGRHDELLQTSSHYRAMWAKQCGFSIDEDGFAFVDPERLRTIPVFRTLETKLLEELANLFVTESYEAGMDVITEGREGDKFYINIRGTLTVSKKRADGGEDTVASLEVGDHFGEIALLRSVPRTATVRAASFVECLSLSRQQFHRIVQAHPEIRQALENALQARAS